MIRALRQRHRRTVLTLGIFLPMAFVAGMASRTPVPVAANLPGALRARPERFTAVEWDRADLFTKPLLQVWLLREEEGKGRFAIEFGATKDFLEPDLMVYWVDENARVTNVVPDNAVLLGAFNSSTALPLPWGNVARPGELVLYSLANHEIVAVSKPVALQKR